MFHGIGLDLTNAALLGGVSKGGGPYIGFVATGARNPTALNAAITSTMTRKLHIARAIIINPAILIPNFYIQANGAGEVGSGGSQTVKASFEYLGVIYPVTFSGSASGTAANNSILKSDPVVGLTIPSGASFFSRMFITCPAGCVYQSGTLIKDLDTAKGDAFVFTGATDLTGGGTVTSTDAVNGFGPCGIVASTIAPSLLILGDSIGYGTRDNASVDSSADLGIIARALGPFYGYSCLSIGGELLSTLTLAKAPLRISQAQYASHVVIEAGTNDIVTNSQTLLQMQALANAAAALFPGKKIFQSTLLPRATGTYPAGTGQAVLASEGVRTAFNDWRRSIPAGFAGCLEMADIYETNASSGTVTTRNGGFWKLNSSFDGTHPNSTNVAGYQAASANNAAFQALFTYP